MSQWNKNSGKAMSLSATGDVLLFHY